MAKINLLPWREEQRAEKAKQFGMAALFTALVGGAVVFAGMKYGDHKVRHQESRNAYLQSEIDALKRDLKEIETLESTKASLLARMDIIQSLQTKRPQVVHTFQELAEKVPDGVYLSEMTQSENNLIFNGKADSNARVSTLMRNLDGSDWFKTPNLEMIESTPEDKKQGITSFKLRLSQSVAAVADQ